MKHYTLCTRQQVRREMGGGEIPDRMTEVMWEPEVEVWSRFAQLASKTMQGLKRCWYRLLVRG